MSYGQNQPWGLQAIKTINGSTWNGQTSQYLIQSGYAFNIFKGDLVFLDADTGYIRNLGDLGNAGLQARQSLGVFNGCSFQTSVATNPIDPASPGRAYWPANTATFNSIDATCDIIDDPSVIFNIQADAAGVPFNAQGKTAAVIYSLGAGNQVLGNTNTGQSNMVLGAGTIGKNNFNLKIIRYVPVTGNVPVGNGNNTVPFNNVEVVIQNHTYATRPQPA